MAEFMENLWNSIFTPGPTPSLLIATNVTFATLQTLLLVLLIATRSWHFVALSTISGGLWWAINWFARELAVERAKEEEQKRKQREEQALKGEHDDGEDAGDDTHTETETETELDASPRVSKRRVAAEGSDSPRSKLSGYTGSSISLSTEGSDAEMVHKPSQSGAAVATGSHQFLSPSATQLHKRRNDDYSELSTDSEWEKVDDKAST
ncbi:Pkr1-domain-containing protein [Eremomyces bilateralis CBS 781.70]|uniref:Pkr1-domain-containing protein n=1 Tax=Eremomyces bilateralis CBS 781.70 TaxID=1392243 RepID=A0A6G1FZT8_9PEZI|nr:Pkr1-domain-containing protein [Eremomyces bilateralis CBS 781.70]KAF1811314.1 Pkr1-domain-containing protein [Eremomyces bilateralis CBS 781.70]